MDNLTITLFGIAVYYVLWYCWRPKEEKDVPDERSAENDPMEQYLGKSIQVTNDPEEGWRIHTLIGIEPGPHKKDKRRFRVTAGYGKRPLLYLYARPIAPADKLDQIMGDLEKEDEWNYVRPIPTKNVDESYIGKVIEVRNNGGERFGWHKAKLVEINDTDYIARRYICRSPKTNSRYVYECARPIQEKPPSPATPGKEAPTSPAEPKICQDPCASCANDSHCKDQKEREQPPTNVEEVCEEHIRKTIEVRQGPGDTWKRRRLLRFTNKISGNFTSLRPYVCEVPAEKVVTQTEHCWLEARPIKEEPMYGDPPEAMAPLVGHKVEVCGHNGRWEKHTLTRIDVTSLLPFHTGYGNVTARWAWSRPIKEKEEAQKPPSPAHKPGMGERRPVGRRSLRR